MSKAKKRGSNRKGPEIETAAMLLEVIPSLMKSIRVEFSQVADSPISLGQFRVMCFLSHESPTNGELAQAVGVAAPTMSRLIDGFVERGLVERKQSRADRRQQTLVLTAQGRKQTDRIREAIRNRMAERIAGLPEARRKTLDDGLKVLSEFFENELGTGPDQCRAELGVANGKSEGAGHANQCSGEVPWVAQMVKNRGARRAAFAGRDQRHRLPG